jgi:hypothetical protein
VDAEVTPGKKQGFRVRIHSWLHEAHTILERVLADQSECPSFLIDVRARRVSLVNPTQSAFGITNAHLTPEVQLGNACP